MTRTLLSFSPQAAFTVAPRLVTLLVRTPPFIAGFLTIRARKARSKPIRTHVLLLPYPESNFLLSLSEAALAVDPSPLPARTAVLLLHSCTKALHKRSQANIVLRNCKQTARYVFRTGARSRRVTASSRAGGQPNLTGICVRNFKSACGTPLLPTFLSPFVLLRPSLLLSLPTLTCTPCALLCSANAT